MPLQRMGAQYTAAQPACFHHDDIHTNQHTLTLTENRNSSTPVTKKSTWIQFALT